MTSILGKFTKQYALSIVCLAMLYGIVGGMYAVVVSLIFGVVFYPVAIIFRMMWTTFEGPDLYQESYMGTPRQAAGTPRQAERATARIIEAGTPPREERATARIIEPEPVGLSVGSSATEEANNVSENPHAATGCQRGFPLANSPRGLPRMETYYNEQDDERIHCNDLDDVP